MADVVLRQWAMLRKIPRQPAAIDVPTLVAALGADGYAADARTVQRDLRALQAHFPIVCAAGSKPYRWSWSRDGARFDLPGLDASAATAFRIVETHASAYLPRATLRALRPWFDHAREILEQQPGSSLKEWPRRVRVIPRGQALLPPAVADTVLDAVQGAVLSRRMLEITYRARGAREARTHTVHPQAIVYRDAVPYLVCLFDNHFDGDTGVLPLQRMQRARMLDTAARSRSGWSLDAVLAEGRFGFPLARAPIVLDLQVDRIAGVTFEETPLSADQTIREVDASTLRVRATVADTHDLRAFLLGFGESVEVRGPRDLRRWMRETARALKHAYER